MRKTRNVALTFAVLACALGAVTRLGAQTSGDVSTEYNRVRNETFVRMEKVQLDGENQLGAFYSFPGRTQQAPVADLTVHFVRSGADWAYHYAYDVVLLLDDKTQLPLTRAQRRASVGHGFVLEQIFIAVSRQQASQIAQAHKVEMKVGGKGFVWSDPLQRSFRQMAMLAARDSAPGAAVPQASGR